MGMLAIGLAGKPPWHWRSGRVMTKARSGTLLPLNVVLILVPFIADLTMGSCLARLPVVFPGLVDDV